MYKTHMTLHTQTYISNLHINYAETSIKIDVLILNSTIIESLSLKKCSISVTIFNLEKTTRDLFPDIK